MPFSIHFHPEDILQMTLKIKHEFNTGHNRLSKFFLRFCLQLTG